MAPKKIIACQLVSVIILVVFAIMLMGAFGEFGSKVSCLVTQFESLKKLDLSDPNLEDFASMIQDPTIAEVVALAKEYVPLLGVAVIAPSVLIAVVELIIVLLSMNFCKNTRCDEMCAKGLIFLLMIFLVLGIGCYGGAAGAGIAITMPAVQAQLSVVNVLCDTKIPEIQETLANGKTRLTAASLLVNQTIKDWPATYPPQIPVDPKLYDAQKQATAGLLKIAAGEVAIQSCVVMCTCVDEMFAVLQTFVTPGFGCVVGCLLLFIANLCDCCALGICGSKKKAVAPAA